MEGRRRPLAVARCRPGRSAVRRWVREDAVVTGEDPWQAQLAALGTLIRDLRRASGLSLRELSDRTGVSNAYLSQIERGLHEPSLRVIRSIGVALEISLEELLERAGMIGDPGWAAPADAEAAITRDRRLSEPQRFALLSVYRSFVPTPPRHTA
jgi:transcriptional regulator with XRE-family HTH domain